MSYQKASPGTMSLNQAPTCVCGRRYRRGRNRRTPNWLATLAELFPEIVKPELDKDDNLPSCSAIEELERQEPCMNQTLAYHALAVVGRLFRRGSITHHGGFVNLASGRMAPMTVGSLRVTKQKKPYQFC